MTHPTEVKLPESLEVVAWRYKTPRTVHLCHSQLDHYFSIDEGATYIKGDALVRLSDAESALKARDAEIERLRGELREREAHFFETRKLLDERPAINAGLFEAYSKWTGKVYSLDWLNAIDQARAEGGEKTK